MEICATKADLHRVLGRHWQSGAAVGLVPTMGALHEGHLGLVRRARARDDVVATSIFVNPTQFGPREDFARYPRTPERDMAMLEADGVDVVFIPAAEEMYPPGFATRVEVGRLGEILEGAARPGHFAGVATVVTKLFNLTRPTRAYFGQKDAQQLAVIRTFVRDLDLPVEVIAVPTVREPDGVAMSSRNRYLAPDERAAATILYRTLSTARDRYMAGERGGDALRAAMSETVAREPLAHLDYANVVDALTMERLDMVDADALLVIAARIGGTRLIDNMPLRSSNE